MRSREGGTELFLPPGGPRRGPAERRPVFYNTAMRVDRDLGVAFARALAGIDPPKRAGWEMLSATGVRGLRLAVESPLLSTLALTETHPEALRVLERNVGLNPGRGARALAHDARRVLDGGPFGYIDLDPYGSPLPFLPAALDGAAAGTVLAVTATDMMVLAGVTPGACERRYGARPIRGRLGPEGGLRILLASVARLADPRGWHPSPLLAYVRDHYVRAYVRIEPGPLPEGRVGPVGATDVGPVPRAEPAYGPMWTGPLFDPALVGGLRVPPDAAEPRELARLLARLQEEVGADVPFYYEPNEIARRLGLAEPPPVDGLLERLRASGHRAARTHARDGAFRTTAPRPDVEAAARALRG